MIMDYRDYLVLNTYAVTWKDSAKYLAVFIIGSLATWKLFDIIIWLLVDVHINIGTY
jgi:hypothetical protein